MNRRTWTERWKVWFITKYDISPPFPLKIKQQRVMLARALYRQPKILLMDEATSQLDLALENHVNTAIRQLNMTRIIIAH
jgi:ABC-type transport system involved in Fe-S cluster assembly fused permease/ATPase subunit